MESAHGLSPTMTPSLRSQGLRKENSFDFLVIYVAGKLSPQREGGCKIEEELNRQS